MSWCSNTCDFSQLYLKAFWVHDKLVRLKVCSENFHMVNSFQLLPNSVEFDEKFSKSMNLFFHRKAQQTRNICINKERVGFFIQSPVP